MTSRINITCEDCGKEFSHNPSFSTIKPKKCPNCRYKALNSKNKGNTTRRGKSSKNTAKTSPKAKARDCADRWFSRYIRIKYSFRILDGDVFCKCFISGGLYSAHHIDSGHCFSRDFKPTRFEEDNCRPQNRSSNRFSGEADHYKFVDKLKEEIGEERFNRIDSLRKELGEDNEVHYREQAKKYRLLVNKMVKEKEINKWW